MEIKTAIVVGMGEIGEPIYHLVGKHYKTDNWDITYEGPPPDQTYDVMHICFPYTPDFLKEVRKYIVAFSPKLLIIESTVKPGTTRQVAMISTGTYVVHSPVRGRMHDTFNWALKAYTKFIGPLGEAAGKVASEYYQKMGMKTCVCDKPEDTEWMKILNTSYWGLLIAWYQECERIAEAFDLNLPDIINFFTSTEVESGGTIPRPTLWVGPIGGHCVLPNARLLLTTYDSNLVEDILRSALSFEASMKSVFGFGQKEGCHLCGRVYTRKIFRNQSEEPFYIIQCLTCREPMIVFREHAVRKEQIDKAREVAKQMFPNHAIDMKMGGIPTHAHFHVRKHLKAVEQKSWSKGAEEVK